MSLCGFIVIQKLLILGKEIFSLQHCVQNKAVCKITSFSSGLSLLEKFLWGKILKSFTWLFSFVFPFYHGQPVWILMCPVGICPWRSKLPCQTRTIGKGGGGLLLCKVQLLFSFWGLVQHRAHGCIGLKPVKSPAEFIKCLSALLGRSQKWSAVCKTITLG